MTSREFLRSGMGGPFTQASTLVTLGIDGDYFHKESTMAKVKSPGGMGKTVKHPKPDKPAKAAKPAKEKSEKKAKPKAPTAAEKKAKLARLLEQKLGELDDCRCRLVKSEATWESAHARAGMLKKEMEGDQADLNQIVRELSDIRNGSYQPQLPIMDAAANGKRGEAKPKKPAAAAVPKELPKTPARLRMLKSVETDSVNLIKDTEYDCRADGEDVYAKEPESIHELKVDPDEYEVVKWNTPIEGDESPPAADPKFVPNQEAWREVPLTRIGLTGKLLECAETAGLSTIGDVSDLQSHDKKRLEDLPGIGPGKAAKIADLIADWFKNNPVDQVA